MARGGPSAAAQAATERLSDEDALRYQPRGNILKMFECQDPEILVEGPAGTGKSLGILQKQHLIALKYPGARLLGLRKTRVSIRQSMKVTWENSVRPHLNKVRFNKDDSEYRYPNGSIVAHGGLDNPEKLFSSEWDGVYIQEATEVTEADVESIHRGLRHGVVPYQQLIMDVNPSYEKHFLNQRAQNGYATRLKTTHKDNPTLWDDRIGDWTEKGSQYIARLRQLHGVRYKRLYLGIWASAEGMVYDEWEPKQHILPFYKPHPDMRWYWSVDFGYTHPFVAQLWVEDFNGKLILYREIYRTQTLVEDHAREMLKMERMLGVHPLQVICDHDAEGRATLERYLERNTVAAHKAIREGVQAVQARLRISPVSGPRIQFLNFPVSPDPNLDHAGKSSPTCTTEEMEGYVWGPNKKGEEPLDRDNHGMDAMRYMVCHVDGLGDLDHYPDLLVTGVINGWY